LEEEGSTEAEHPTLPADSTAAEAAGSTVAVGAGSTAAAAAGSTAAVGAGFMAAVGAEAMGAEVTGDETHEDNANNR
jgi:hypothetical protein